MIVYPKNGFMNWKHVSQTVQKVFVFLRKGTLYLIETIDFFL